MPLDIRWSSVALLGLSLLLPSVAAAEEAPDAPAPATPRENVASEPSPSSPSSRPEPPPPERAPRYYVEPALLIPFVYKGSRSVQLSPMGGSSELRLSVVEDWHVTAAPMLQYFPFGRQKGSASSYRNCRWRSCIDQTVGVQVGAGLLDFLREWYFGLVYEPISGLSVGAGVALLKGDFMPHGLAEGMLLPSADQKISNSQYMFRPYFGISLTLDILQTSDRAFSAVSPHHDRP